MEKYIYSKQGFIKNILNYSESELPIIEESIYRPIKLKQSNGKERTVYTLADESVLSKVQRKLIQNFFSNFYFSDAAHGFVQGKSYRSFLEVHMVDPYEQKDKLFLKVDIKDFFPSITKELVEDSLEEYFKMNEKTEKPELLSWTVNAITLNGRLPMGAMTSPVISNLVFRRIDSRIQKYCLDTEITYSRYADDLLFSSYKSIIHRERFINLIIGILKDYGMELNFNKIRRGKGIFSINGFVISDTLRLSRKKLIEIKRVLFTLDNISKKCIKQQDLLLNINSLLYSNSAMKRFSSLSHLNNYLAGYRSFLIAWIPNQDTSFQKETKKLISRIEKHIEYISENI